MRRRGPLTSSRRLEICLVYKLCTFGNHSTKTPFSSNFRSELEVRGTCKLSLPYGQVLLAKWAHAESLKALNPIVVLLNRAFPYLKNHKIACIWNAKEAVLSTHISISTSIIVYGYLVSNSKQVRRIRPFGIWPLSSDEWEDPKRAKCSVTNVSYRLKPC